jgi:hypothetical protein
MSGLSSHRDLYSEAMDVVEILPNIFINKSVIELIDDPRQYLRNRDKMKVKEIGGIHNLHHSDLVKWARDDLHHNTDAVRIIERGTQREEIVWPITGGGRPEFISVRRSDGIITSHLKNGKRPQPATRQRFELDPHGAIMAERWYKDGVLHRDEKIKGELQPAISAHNPYFAPVDPTATYIVAFKFGSISEIWKYGEWKATLAEKFEIVFSSYGNEDPWRKNLRAINWIAKHCRHGFYPMGEKLFPNGTEEFLFMADIAA